MSAEGRDRDDLIADLLELLAEEERRRGGAPGAAARPGAAAGLDLLDSADADERRRAIRTAASAGLDDDAIAAVADRLVNDTEAEVRAAAVAALATRPDRVPIELARRALDDDADEVSSRAVGLVATYGADTIADLVRVAVARERPSAQKNALFALARSIDAHGIDDERLTGFVTAVGRLDPGPTSREQTALAAVARAIGAERLLSRLADADQRVGAVRLLLEEGSSPALQAVAELADDADDDLRIAAAFARSMLAGHAQPAGRAAAAGQPTLVQSPRSDRDDAAVTDDAQPAADQARVAELAHALTSGDEHARDRASASLAATNRRLVQRWVRSALRTGTEGDAVAASQAARALGLTDSAGDILDRAAGLPRASRSDLLATLADLGIEPAALTDLARSVDATRRHEAVRLVWEVSGPASIPHLKPLLRDSSGPVRMAALDVVAASDDTEAPALALEILRADSSPAVRATAVKAFRSAGIEDRLIALAVAVEDPDPDVRATALEVLLEGASRRARDVVLRALDDPDDRVREAAIRHVASLTTGDTSVLWTALRNAGDDRREALLAALSPHATEQLDASAALHRHSSDPSDRALAAQLAGHLATRGSIAYAVEALRDPVPAVRRAAAGALTTAPNPEAIGSLSQALTDPDLQVRLRVVTALGMIDDDGVVEALISALTDPEVRVREQASSVLVRWSSPPVARQLVAMLTSAEVSVSVRPLLARMGQVAIEPLVDALLAEDADLAANAGSLLGEMTGPDRFIEGLGALDRDERERCVEALGAIGGPRAVAALTQALTDPDQTIRIRALRRLGRIGDRHAYEAVRRTFASDPVPEVVAAAEEALRRLEPTA